MGKPVTEHERDLIEDLLKDGFSPRQAAFLVGRGERTGFYVQAEMRRRKEERKATSRIGQVVALVKGVFYAKEEANRTGGRATRRPQE